MERGVKLLGSIGPKYITRKRNLLTLITISKTSSISLMVHDMITDKMLMQKFFRETILHIWGRMRKPGSKHHQEVGWMD